MQHPMPSPDAVATALRDAPEIRVRIPAAPAFSLLAFLQLALRHPEAGAGSAADHARHAAIDLADALCQRAPLLEPVIRAGWDPVTAVLWQEGRR